MTIRTLIAAALLASSAGIAVALAAPEIAHWGGHHHQRRDGVEASAASVRPVRLAEEGGDEEHGERHGDARHDDDDEDDDAGDGGSVVAAPQGGPSAPNAPVPDNGLFNGTARPKVEVQ